MFIIIIVVIIFLPHDAVHNTD